MRTALRNHVPSRSEGGFTLLEIMVVVTIMAIVAALCMPSFFSMWSNAKKYTVATQFADLGLLAHNRAIFTREEVEIVLDLKDTGSYWIRKPSKKRFSLRSDDTKERFVELPEDYEIEEVINLDTGKRDRSGEASILFHPDGTAEAMRVVMKRTDKRRDEPLMLVFTVKRATGQIKWKEYPGHTWFEEDEDAGYN